MLCSFHVGLAQQGLKYEIFRKYYSHIHEFGL